MEKTISRFILKNFSPPLNKFRPIPTKVRANSETFPPPMFFAIDYLVIGMFIFVHLKGPFSILCRREITKFRRKSTDRNLMMKGEDHNLPITSSHTHLKLRFYCLWPKYRNSRSVGSHSTKKWQISHTHTKATRRRPKLHGGNLINLIFLGLLFETRFLRQMNKIIAFQPKRNSELWT